MKSEQKMAKNREECLKNGSIWLLAKK